MNDLSHAAEQAVAHAARLNLYARQWLRNSQAEDVVQGALVRLLSQRTAPSDPLAWMYTVVRRAAIDQARANSRRRQREECVARERSEWFEPTPGAALDAESAQKAMELLTREMREIVVLRIWGELSFAQIARVTEISVGSAHQRFTEALKQMRSSMENICLTQASLIPLKRALPLNSKPSSLPGPR